MTRPVRLAKSGATSGKRLPKVCCPHAGLRHRQRASLSRSITLAPWTGRSCNCRTYQPCRKFDSRPQPGHRPPPAVMADTTQAASAFSAPKTRTPGPGAQSALSLMPHQHTGPGDRTIPLHQDSQGTPTQIEADPHIGEMFQIGLHASGSARQEEVDAALAYGSHLITAYKVHNEGIESVLAKIPDGGNYYAAIDLDGRDPAIAPAVFAPCPGGLTFMQVRKLLRGLVTKGRVVGMDVVEIVPSMDVNKITCITAGRLIANLIGAAVRAN